MKIHYTTPYATDKNFGKAINDFCALIPDSDWICLLDGDAMFLSPDWGVQIEELVKKHGKEFSIFGCVTNRLARPMQRYMSEFSNNHDVLHHYGISEKLKEEKWASVKDITRTRLVAGLCFLFPKKLWQQIKFEENTHFFDDKFSKKAVSLGYRLGLMEGVYMYHFYRGWSDTPIHDISHLQKNV